MKTKDQRIAEAVLLLRVLHKDNNILGNLKLQKEIFLAEVDFLEKGLGGLYYKFFRYNYGPYSNDLHTDYMTLANKGFIHKTTYTLTDRGKYLVEFVDGICRDHKNNARVFHALDRIVEKYRPYNGTQLKSLVYNLKIEPDDMPGRKMRIEDIPVFTDLILPEYRHYKYCLEVPSHVLADIEEELKMDQETWDSLERNQSHTIREATRSLIEAISLDPR